MTSTSFMTRAVEKASTALAPQPLLYIFPVSHRAREGREPHHSLCLSRFLYIGGADLLTGHHRMSCRLASASREGRRTFNTHPSPSGSPLSPRWPGRGT